MAIDISAKLLGIVKEPIYPGPEVDPTTVDWMNLPTRWVAAFDLKDGGRVHVPLNSVEQAESLSLNASYKVTISEG